MLTLRQSFVRCSLARAADVTCHVCANNPKFKFFFLLFHFYRFRVVHNDKKGWHRVQYIYIYTEKSVVKKVSKSVQREVVGDSYFAVGIQPQLARFLSWRPAMPPAPGTFLHERELLFIRNSG